MADEIPQRPRPTTVEQLRALTGASLGVTTWLPLPQAEVDSFAKVTGDDQWIHIDAARATSGPFGGTIVHGLYILSLGPALMDQLLTTDGFAHAVNYGYDKVRFPRALPVGGSVRLRAEITEVVAKSDSVVQIVISQRFEGEGIDKPVCIADAVAQLHA